MFKKFIAKQRKERIQSMRARVPDLSDSMLKEWYAKADLSVQLGNDCKDERALLRDIDAELERRGFEFQTDY